MATKTLYVKDSDLPLFEQAQKQLGGNLSAILVDCIRRRLAAGVTDETLKFFDVEKQLGINVVALSAATLCPRVGESVMLPGENGVGCGPYKVVGVYHSSSALCKTDPPVLSKSDPGNLTEPRPPRLRDDDDESSRCQRPGRDHARSAAGGSDRMRG